MRKRGCLIAIAVVLLAAVGVGGAAYHQYRRLAPEGQYFDSDGVRLHYIVRGEGEPVVLIHGLGASIGVNWVSPGILDALAASHKVVAFDMRGHGRSAKPDDPGAYGEELVLDVVRLMDHLDIQKAQITGYSLGGFVAVKLAQSHPERVVKVAACASGWAADPEEELAFLRDVADDLEKGNGMRKLIDRLHPDDGELERASIEAAVMTVNHAHALAAVLRTSPELQLSKDEVAHIEAPVLALVGAQDPFRDFAESLAKTVPNGKLVVVPEADHLTLVRNDAFAQHLRAFLGE